MASAVRGFITSFGIDEPMGCYEDIDYADVFATLHTRTSQTADNSIIFKPQTDLASVTRSSAMVG